MGDGGSAACFVVVAERARLGQEIERNRLPGYVFLGEKVSEVEGSGMPILLATRAFATCGIQSVTLFMHLRISSQ